MSRSWPLQILRTGFRQVLPSRLVDAYFEVQSGTPPREAVWRYLAGWPEFSYCTRTRHGWLTYSNKDWALGRPLFLRGEIDYGLIMRVVAELAASGQAPGGLVVDVGANIGTTTITLLRGRHFTRAIAIEPIASNARRLGRNLWLNGLRHRVRIVRGAAGPAPTTVAMTLSPTNHGDHRIAPSQSLAAPALGEAAWPTIRVPCYRLDDVVATEPALLWMDVQGYELRVLEGARRLLTTGVPVVMEFGPYWIARAGITVEEFCAFVRAHFATIVDLGVAGSEPMPAATIDRFFPRYPGQAFTDLLLRSA